MRKYNVLVVDDEVLMLKLIESAIAKLDCGVITATSAGIRSPIHAGLMGILSGSAFLLE